MECIYSTFILDQMLCFRVLDKYYFSLVLIGPYCRFLLYVDILHNLIEYQLYITKWNKKSGSDISPKPASSKIMFRMQTQKMKLLCIFMYLINKCAPYVWFMLIKTIIYFTDEHSALFDFDILHIQSSYLPFFKFLLCK